MRNTIKMAIDELILKLNERGMHTKTILNYKIVCNLVMSYGDLKEEGIDNYKNLFQEYINKLEIDLEKMTISKGYVRFQKRVVRLLECYLDNGVIDFSTPTKYQYIPNTEHQTLIIKILDYSNLYESSRYTLEPPMRHFFCFTEKQGVTVSQLTDEVFFLFLSSVSDSNKGSIKRTFRALTLISEYIKKNNLANLKADLSMLKIKSAPTNLIEPYYSNEMSNIFDAIDDKSVIGIRDKAILLLAYQTGLRSIDIANLKFMDINWKNSEINVMQSKTNELLILPLSNMVKNALADYILNVRPDCSLSEIFLTTRAPYRAFRSSRSLRSCLDKYCNLGNVEKKSGRGFHSIRRAYATEMSMAGVALPIISQMLGHKGINNDKPYLTYNQEQNALCSIDFSEIPIKNGVYSSDCSVFDATDKGGCSK